MLYLLEDSKYVLAKMQDPFDTGMKSENIIKVESGDNEGDD